MGSIWGILVVIGALVFLFAVLKLLEKVDRPHPELLRKLMHVGMGLLVISFPWLFGQTWPVLLLAGLTTVLLGGMKLVPRLRDGVGSVLTGVNRPSLGELCFPVAVGLLWVMCRGNWLLYVIPMLILTLADAVAALVGVAYGKVRYVTSEGFKSAEGSLAFFSIAFLSVHIPLLLCTDVGRAQSLLIAAIIGVLSMLIEAICARGLDNLLIPLGAFAFLKLYREETVHQLELRLAITVALLVFALSWRRRSTLDDSALIACALFGYGVAMLGGPIWMVGPIILFFCHVIFWPRKMQRRDHTVYAVVSVTLGALFWLGLHVAYGQMPMFYLPYAVLMGTHLALITISRVGMTSSQTTHWLRLGGSICIGWAIVMLQVLPLMHGPMATWTLVPVAMLAGLAGVIVGTGIFFVLMPRLYGPRGTDREIHTAGFACGMVASILAFGIHLLLG